MQLELDTRKGREKEVVEAEEIVPGLAAHRELGAYPGTLGESFAVSHIPTGLKLSGGFRIIESAALLARQVAEFADWTKMEPVPEEEGKDLGLRIRARALAILRQEDRAEAKAEDSNKRLWHVNITAEIDVPVWAATEEEAKDVAGDEDLFRTFDSFDVDVTAWPMKGHGGFENDRPYGREGALTCGDLAKRREDK